MRFRETYISGRITAALSSSDETLRFQHQQQQYITNRYIKRQLKYFK